MKFSIIGVPWERRVQTTFVFAYLLFILTCLILWLCCLLNPILWIFYIPYCLFVKYIDNPARNGGRPIQFVRNSSFWKRFGAYFPATLQFQNDWHKTADEKDKYLLALHPHGIVGLGVWANVLSNGSNLHTLLPGLNLRVVTLPLNFLIPIWREFIVSLGLIDSHEQSIVTALSKGASVGIVVGGAAEALNAIPDKDYVLTLKNRRGFIRIAMKQGVPIVPVFSFGENDLFHLADHPLLRKVQNAAKNVLGFSTPLFIGRGIFNYSFGLLPHRKRIVTIIGKPIPVQQVDNPSGAELDEMHKIYTTALREMYYAYRDEHDSNRELIID